MTPGNRIQMLPPERAAVVSINNAEERAQVESWFKRLRAAEADKETWEKACQTVLPLYRGEHNVNRDLDDAWVNRVTVPLLKSVHEAKMPWLHAALPRFEPSSNPLLQVCQKIVTIAWGVQDIFRQTGLSVNEAQQINVSGCFAGWDRKRRLPNVKHWPAEDILVDPDARNDLAEARWIALREILPLHVIKNNPNFNFQRQELDTQSYADTGSDDRAKSSQRMANAKIGTLYHVWTKDGVPPTDESGTFGRESDVASFRLITLCKFYPYPLRNVPWPFLLGATEFPLEIIKYRDFVSIGDQRISFWGAPSGEAVKRLLYGIDWATTFKLEHGRVSAAAKLIGRGEWTDEKIRQLLSNKDMEFILGDDNLRVELVQFAQTFPQLDQMLDWCIRIFDQIEGFDQILRGGQGRTQTATEAGIRGEHAQSRLEHDAKITQDFVQKLARKVLKIARLYMTPDDVNRLLGPQAAQLWMEHQNAFLDPRTGQIDFAAMVESLDSDLVLNVEPGSIRFKDAQLEVQKSDKVLQTWLPIYLQEGWLEHVLPLMDYWYRANQIPGYQTWLPGEEAIRRSLMMRMMPAPAPQEAAEGGEKQ